VGGLVIATKPIELSDKGLIRAFLERNRNEWSETLDFFKNSLPEWANAVIGIQISTTTQSFRNGIFLYVTMAGTPVRYRLPE
jgi:regulator of nucleoside diphosphate kinase